jgi:hypothetical protein
MSDQLVAEAAVYTTHSEHETNIHAPGGIRTDDPSNGAADYALDRTVTGVSRRYTLSLIYSNLNMYVYVPADNYVTFVNCFQLNYYC